MRSRFELAVSTLIAIAAVSVSAAALHREFFARSANAHPPEQGGPPTYLSAWRAFPSAGVTVGDSLAPVKIVEFADLECPFCRVFHERVERIRREFGDKVALVYIHYPLPNHRFARPAARAMECAASQGRFAEFQTAVFAKQDSLGLRSWAAYATDAQVTDRERFAQCAADTSTVARIEAGVALGAQIHVRGTPTVIVNGWRFPTPPDESVLSETIRALLAGKPPANTLTPVRRPR